VAADCAQAVRDAPQVVRPLCEELCWLGLDWEEAPEMDIPGRIEFLYRSPHYQRHLLEGRASRRPHPLLARVVADHALAITHIIRDARWLPQMVQELALYQALGWEAPHYVHLPPIEMPKGGDCATSPDSESIARTADYRARGYLPLALANHLVRLGWTPRGKRELLSLHTLAERLDVRRVLRMAASRRPVPFDPQQLNWFNRRALCALAADEVTALLLPRWQSAYGVTDRAEGTALSPGEWQRALAQAIRPELDRLDQVAERARFAFVDQIAPLGEARAALSQPYAGEVLRAFVRELPAVEPFTYAPIDAWIGDLRRRFKAALGVSHGVRSRDVMYVLRAALTGRMEGPCLVEVCQLLGVERCAARARAASQEPKP
jgi:nondiscriminating glutamyl-tRNA synthetase